MASRQIIQQVPAMDVTEGAGVTVRRTLGTPVRRHLDPFLMLDHFSSADPNDYIAGFPDHPHRGFITFTYMLDGHMQHRDSMGNEGDLQPGGAQWMKAASGVIHSEMPKQRGGLMRGFQLWINLPAAEKMSEPAYQELTPEAVPEIEAGDVRVRVLVGHYGGRRGPIEDPHTGVQYLDVGLRPGGRFTHTLSADLNAFVYVFEGAASVGNTALPGHHLAVLGPGEEVAVDAGNEGARLILAAGRPLGEPIVQYGPFVMTSRDDIEQALSDYREGRLVRQKPGVLEL